MRTLPPGDTPVRSVRISDQLWSEVRAAARRRGITITDAVREALLRWVSAQRRRR